MGIDEVVHFQINEENNTSSIFLNFLKELKKILNDYKKIYIFNS